LAVTPPAKYASALPRELVVIQCPAAPQAARRPVARVAERSSGGLSTIAFRSCAVTHLPAGSACDHGSYQPTGGFLFDIASRCQRRERFGPASSEVKPGPG
jgi:hypothetical protein